MTQDARAGYDRALESARTAAYPPGEFVGQESFMRAGEILSLARRAGVGPGVDVLDLCCGVGGPGRLITSRLRCSYLGVDTDPGAIELARARAAGLSCRFEVASVPPLPNGRFDVVLLLETMLAFPDKKSLLRDISAALVPGGRFAFTLEEGVSLTDVEKARMPAADTVWLTPLRDIVCGLDAVGLEVRSVQECTRSHRQVAEALTCAFLAERSTLAVDVGDEVIDDLVAAHRLWSEWMSTGRVRKFEVVAQKSAERMAQETAQQTQAVQS